MYKIISNKPAPLAKPFVINIKSQNGYLEIGGREIFSYSPL